MSLRKFITSKQFFIQIILAVVAIMVLTFVILKWLSISTNHGEEITVPDLSKLSVEAAEEKLDQLDLKYVLLDTTEYNDKYPKFSVIKQDPVPGAKVKSGRKIYIKVNADSYRSIILPNLIQKTLRQVEPTILSLGLHMGKKTYKPHLGKDMVLEVWQNGKKLKAGDEVLKNSKVDLVLGDGKIAFEEEETESLNIYTESEEE